MSTKSKLLITIVILIVLSITAFSLVRNQDRYTTMPPPQLPNPPLKALAKEKGIQIGSFASLKYLRESIHRYIIL
jgi:hypothetical protein